MAAIDTRRVLDEAEQRRLMGELHRMWMDRETRLFLERCKAIDAAIAAGDILKVYRLLINLWERFPHVMYPRLDI